MIDQFRRFLSVPVFVSRAWSELAKLSGDDYRMRSRPGSKQLIEEVFPVAVLLLHLWSSTRTVRCRFVGSNKNHDAELTMSGREVDLGYYKSRYYVEVTTAAHPDEHLRREALTRNGFVYLGGPIRRVNEKGAKRRPLVSEAVAVDGESLVRDVIEWVGAAVVRKSAKDYPRPCILLVNVDAERPLSVKEWAQVQSKVRDRVDRNRFVHVFAVGCSRNVLVPL